MTPLEGQELFNQTLGLVLSCYIYGLGIGLGLKMFKQALK